MTQIRFRKIDETTIGDHYHLRPGDVCLYLYEYTSGVGGYKGGSENQLVSNLKKKPTASPPELRHKRIAIERCAKEISTALNPNWLRSATLVPTPPSKVRADPLFDERVEQICRKLPVDFPVDVREIVVQTESVEAAHETSGTRRSLSEQIALYRIDESKTSPAPTSIAIVDDVLTAATHYRAMHTVLSERFPSVPIIGIFVARRVFPNDQAAAAFSVIEL